ncbi:DUF4864 domain-containing protein [Nitratireductor sp. ZSWI3]|uniref:DUF4864 domain-containing protein n=1 Tax=Nitratireductor sp. ZSWI3 TaxID=2966359 RepID=UPI00214FFDDA|nr:DUF4864 domain-containing protein [Nitratireductor sp. ZSWI3]MCR4268949.1 DUF4864 domain-containing protein [Nitratireductor sp. ZSWI3]
MLRALVLTLLLALSPAFAFAGEAEIRAARSSITAQIDAFRDGDDERAYSYTAPSVKRVFPTVDRFMLMVMSGFQPIYRPLNYAFGTAKEVNETAIVQRVILTGPDSRCYEALYALERQADGVYLITGVWLKPSASVAA